VFFIFLHKYNVALQDLHDGSALHELSNRVIGCIGLILLIYDGVHKFFLKLAANNLSILKYDNLVF